MYYIDIYNKDFSTKITTLVSGIHFYKLSYLTEINKGGTAEFQIETSSVIANTTNFSVYNKIKIRKDGSVKFIGYMETFEVDLNITSVKCVGMLGFFQKRLYSGVVSGSAENAIYGILSSINSLGNTGILQGVSSITGTVSGITFERSDVFSAWNKIIDLVESEMEIDADLKLNLSPRLGSNKVSSISFNYILSQSGFSNLLDFSVSIDGKDMANRVTGVGNGGITQMAEDLPSKTLYGCLESAISFLQTTVSLDLSAETLSYLNKNKIEFYTPNIKVNPEMIPADSVNLGDTVRVLIKFGLVDLDRYDRVIQKQVSLKDNGQEEMNLKLMPEDINKLPKDFFGDILKDRERVSLLESQI